MVAFRLLRRGLVLLHLVNTTNADLLKMHEAITYETRRYLRLFLVLLGGGSFVLKMNSRLGLWQWFLLSRLATF